MPILHHISANSYTYVSDAITLVGSMGSLGLILTVCHKLALLALSLPEIVGAQNFGSNL